MTVARTAAGAIVALVLLVLPAAAGEQNSSPTSMSLAGSWTVRLDPGDAGVRESWQTAEFTQALTLPGSLTTNNIGDELSTATRWTGGIADSAWYTDEKYAPYRQPGNIKVPFWLTPQKYYVGAAWYQREITIPETWKGKEVILFLERAHWQTDVWLDGNPAGTQNSLSAPHEYALGNISPGRHRLIVRVDNTVKINVGRDAHSISDHTQTNWNGLIGTLELRAYGPLRLTDVQVYPDIGKQLARVRATVTNASAHSLKTRLTLSAQTIGGPAQHRPPALTVDRTIPSGQSLIEVDLAMGSDVRLWSEFAPTVYALTADISARLDKRKLTDHARTTFGMREFGSKGTNFTVNGKVTFLRGTLEGCTFPLTGYPPTEIPEWERVFGVAKEYGLNHIRFHSWCPPEAAFEAADNLGLILHVETPVWTRLGEDSLIDAFIYAESDRILKAYGNHPSFCMLAVGNEPSGPKREEFLTGIVSYWKKKDPRRLYTTCSGWPILPVSNYNSTPEPRVQYRGNAMQSRFNTQPLSTDVDYTDIISRYPVPTVSHEIGEWCVFPDLKETTQYTGILKARNFEIVRDDLEQRHMFDQAEDFLMASGRLQVLEYKEEIEAALRTKGFGGFQLLGLHDFPGQGTALVGMLNVFWRPKGYLSAEESRRFCSAAVPLMRMTKVVWSSNEQFATTAQFANYSASDLQNVTPEWSLKRPDGTILASGLLARQSIPQGGLATLGEVKVSLRDVGRATKLTLTLGLSGMPYLNTWDIWVYPQQVTVRAPEAVLVAHEVTPAVEEALQEGRTVLLMAEPKTVNSLVPAGFSSIFWNTAWGGKAPPHTLGILCDPRNPLFTDFPTENYSTWHWWDLISASKAMVLDSLHAEIRPLIRVIDDWYSNRNLGLLFDAKVGAGRLVMCSIDLSTNIGARPVARQFLHSLFNYVSAPPPQRLQPVDLAAVRSLFRRPTAMDEAKLLRVDSEVSGFEGALAVDGDPTTFWHTPWEGSAPKYPHTLDIDLGKELDIQGYSLRPRTDGITGGWVSKASISVSEDGQRWGTAISTDSFARDKKEKRVTFRAPVRGRFVRLTLLEGFAGQDFASLAEFRVIGVGEE